MNIQEVAFKKAERKKVKLKIALSGPSGSGKTYSALSIAKGIGGRIALIDTENGSASLYSDKFDFDVLEMNPPYSVEKYIIGINKAIEAGYDILILDSITHQWRGEGGILYKKEQMDSLSKTNSFANWAKLTPEQDKFVSAISHSNIHMICTMRSKQDYVIETNDKGKQVPRKIGMAPIQREGIEYEFTTFFEIDPSHSAVATKDRTGIFVELVDKINEETGKKFLAWLSNNEQKNEPTQPMQQKPAPLKNYAPTGLNK